jgi:predicted glycogen debranching enzyme
MKLATLRLPWNVSDDPALLRDREWLVTNGLGGYASGSLLGIATRRHHGLFVPNLANPKGRYIMISRFDEDVDCDSRKCVQLGGAEFLDGRLETQTHLYLKEFRLEGLIPTWLFNIHGRLIEKTIVMPHNQNSVCVQYRLLEGEPVDLRLRMFVAFRRHDQELIRKHDWPFTLSITRDRYEIHMRDNPLQLRFGIRPEHGVFVNEERESHDVLYRVERDRGYDHAEDQYSPGYFAVRLHRDEPISFVATTQSWESLSIDGPTALEAEHLRNERLVSAASLSAASSEAQTDFAARLVTAADQFIVLPGSRLEEKALAEASGSELRTVIAGYHWFGDWGRDTMISLEGLTLCTGRHREAAAILQTFSQYVRDGLLPNLFPEGERDALYHTVDATLWYFHAIERYRVTANDNQMVHMLYPVLKSIIEHHIAGTHYGIGVDARDGLLHAGAAGYQLTWMDAKAGDWVVTPRRGKPVEIQALWFNALMLMASWSELLSLPTQDYRERALHAQRSFNQRYPDPAQTWLLDVVDGEQGNDAACRPNQIFSISLQNPILDATHWKRIVDVVQSKLLTPFGLRTLSSEHPDYKKNYHGDLLTRDAAYHQGTVWPWLIGHFIDAWLKVYKDKAQARTMLHGFSGHLYEAGVGSISEVFDAESPYLPRGCIAQAWSVAEVLRAWLRTETPAEKS